MADNKLKGDIGEYKTVIALLESNINVLKPLGDRLPFDVLAEKDNQFVKIQCKFRNNNKNGYMSARISHRHNNYKNTVDVLAVYSPSHDRVYFIKVEEIKSNTDIRIKFQKESEMAIALSNALRIFDQCNIIDIHNKRGRKPGGGYSPREQSRKVVRPTKEELFELVWSTPTSEIGKRFGVSDCSVSKWCKYYGIQKPGRGYWAKKRAI